MPLGDDLDRAVRHLDGGLIVNCVCRDWNPGGPSFDAGQRRVLEVFAIQVHA